MDKDTTSITQLECDQLSRYGHISDNELQNKLREVHRDLTELPRVTVVFGWVASIFVSIGIPMLVLFGQQPANDNARIQFNFDQFDLYLTLVFVAVGFSNILFARSFTIRSNAHKQISKILICRNVQPKYHMRTSDTQASKIISRLQLTYIFGTFFVASLWYLFPQHGRLEPLAVIYGFGTALFGYYRTRLSINSPIDRYLDVANSN